MANGFVLNQFPTTYGATVALFADMLFAAGWTYQGSGDGLAGYSAGGKVFTNTTSGAALSWSNPKAWARMQDPAAARELLLQHDNAGNARIRYSAASKFTAGAPSAIVTPSAADERLLRGGGTDAAPTYGTWLNSTILLAGAVFQGFARGTAPYGFWFGGQASPGGAKMGFIAIDPLEGAAPEDTDPVVVHIAHTGACGNPHVMRPAATASSWNFAAAPSNEGGFAHMDVARTAFANVLPYQWGWCADSRVIPQPAVIAGAIGGFVNPFNLKYDAFPLLYARIQAGATTTPGHKGWSSMMRWTGVGRASFSDTFDSRNWIAYGALWLSWDGLTVPRN